MLDLIVHIAAIGAVIGYVEYRLRSYAALMVRFDQFERRQDNSLEATTDRLLKVNEKLSQTVAGSLEHQGSQITNLLSEHGAVVMETERIAMRQMRDTVGSALKNFSESIWRGVHNMAQTIQLPASPTFTCYYCGQTFPATMRERIGENDYCPDHGFKRQQPVVAKVHVTAGVAPASETSRLPWEN